MRPSFGSTTPRDLPCTSPPREQDKPLVSLAARLARARQARGPTPNHPGAVALLSHEIVAGARAGRSVAEPMAHGKQILTADDGLPGVAALPDEVRVEATFPDGTKLVTGHAPIPHEPDDGPVPGEILLADEPSRANPGRAVAEVTVRNTSDRPVQVGSHAHFFEVNRALAFDRAAAFGLRLNVPAGTAVRIEPGEERIVGLVALGGACEVHGLSALTDGPTGDRDPARAAARGVVDEPRIVGAQRSVDRTVGRGARPCVRSPAATLRIRPLTPRHSEVTRNLASPTAERRDSSSLGMTNRRGPTARP